MGYLDIPKFLREKSSTTIKCLLKVGKREHLEQLADGKMRCQSLGFYRSEENNALACHDAHDGITSVLQSDLVSLRIGQEGGEFHTLSRATGLTGPVLITMLEPNPVFCMHSINTGDWTGKPISKENIVEYRRYLEVPKRMKEYGDSVWVVDPGPFVDRVTQFCKDNRYGLRCRLVKYLDFKNSHGDIPEEWRGLVKDSFFKDEREFRFVFDVPNPTDPMIFQLPSLRDISSVMPLEEFMQDWAIQLPDGTTARGRDVEQCAAPV